MRLFRRYALPLLSERLFLFFFGRAGLTRRNALPMPLKIGYVMMGFTELRNAGGKLGLK